MNFIHFNISASYKILAAYTFIVFLFSNVIMGQPLHDNANEIRDFNELPKIKWKFKIGSSIYSSPVISEKLVYFGGLDSIFYSVEIESGKEKWRFRSKGEIRSNACINNDRLYLNGGDGNLYALNNSDGKPIWVFKTLGEKKYDFADYFQSTPVLMNGVLYFGSGDGNLYAVFAESGKLKWSYQTGNIVHTTAAIDIGKVFFCSFDGNV